jgi:hypothetical protein
MQSGMVYNDQPSDPELLQAVPSTRCGQGQCRSIVGCQSLMPVWNGFYSSNTAAWFALWMGCDPVILWHGFLSGHRSIFILHR